MLKLIINADDLGYSSTVNEAVFSLVNSRRITSATVLVSGDAFADACTSMSNFPGCSFGVHLDLMELSSLTASDVFLENGVTDETGRFVGAIRNVRPSSALKQAVVAEWCAQIEKALDSGVPCSHLDSHFHVHTIPWLFGTLKKVQRKFGIRKVRKSLNWYFRPEVTPSAKLLLCKGLWNTALRCWYVTKTTSYFTNFAWFLQNMTRQDDVRVRGTAELMVHPGHPLMTDETDLLWTDWQSRISCRIELITYNEL